MARFEISGLDYVEKQLLRRSRNARAAAETMIQRGADVIIKAQMEEIVSMDLVKSGALHDSLKVGKVKEKDNEVFAEIYPHGTDKKGVRNALKGAIAEYGRVYREKGKVKFKAARPWRTAANNKCVEEVHAEMRKAWEEKMGNGG